MPFLVFVLRNFFFPVRVFIAVCRFSLFYSIWFLAFVKNDNWLSDLIFEVIFTVSYYGSGSSLIWAAIMCLHQYTIAKECMMNQMSTK